ncbi:MAG TPA: ABC transporter ATP-binding protein [Gemmatimonadaceae bacterium]
MTSAAIEANGLTAYFGTRKVVDELTMSVPRGSVFAFLGRNGSGKTTTIRMLLGLLAPTRGSSTVLGYDSRQLPPEARARVGYMSESHSLYEWMTVRQCGDFQSRFYPKWNPRVFDAVIGHFHLDLRAKAGDLSRGERAGLSLAITLAPEPELLVLDDPAIGLDPVARRSLLESMIHVTRGANRTIFFSSHLLDDVERVADYIAILDRSVLRASCSIDTFRASVRKFALHYGDAGAPPPQLPVIRGLLHARRSARDLTLTIATPDDDTRRLLGSLGATVIDEVPVTFDEAMIGYLGDRGDQQFFLKDIDAPQPVGDIA